MTAMPAMPAWTVRVRLVVLGVVTVVVLFLFVFPTRSFLAQKHEVDRVQQNLSVFEQQNRDLQREVNRLQTPAEIERIARQRFNMVHPGEKSYRIVPAPPAKPQADQSTPTTTQ